MQVSTQEEQIRGFKPVLFLFVLKRAQSDGIGLHTLQAMSFPRDEEAVAQALYVQTEAECILDPLADAVLVSADSINTLGQAYPSYYLDTEMFLSAIDRYLRR